MTGNYDCLNDPEIVEENIDYYCFTNNKFIKSSIWNVVYIDDDLLPDNILARKVKILGHDLINGKYDIYVWMDSNFRIVKSVNEFINRYCDFSKSDYFTFKHHARKNINEEMQACLYAGKETEDNVNRLKQFYITEKYLYDSDNNLCETGIIIKKISKVVKKTMDVWFEILINYSCRDQLSFNYAASITKLNFHQLNMSLYDNMWFKLYNHNNKKSKFSVYFKQRENDGINEYATGDKIYLPSKVISNKLSFDIIVPKNCNYIDIDASALSDFVIVGTKITSKNKINYSYINVYQYGNNIVSKNDDSILRLSGNFEKNDKIIVCLLLNEDKMQYISNYINEQIANLNQEISNKEKIIKQLAEENKKINKLYGEIVNSKRWKFINKLKK